MPDSELGDNIRHGDETREHPSTNQPLNAPEKRPVWKPLIVVVAVFAALILAYLLGLAVLVPSD